MAVYVVRMQVIGRSAGRSATAAAAYRSGEQVKDERTGKTHDYTGKSDIYDSEILKPENAPERLGDRTTLWNEVERGEKRKDAQLSREFLVALPAELNHYQRQSLTRDFVQEQFVDQGMIADIGYHDFSSHNPHAHIMLTMREVSEEGFGKKKREWNKREQLQRQREAWAKHANSHLERAGYEARIDHRSLKEQGSERQPQPKLGPAVMNMESKGIRTDKGNEFRRVNAENRALERKQLQRDKVRADIEAERKMVPRPSAQPTAIASDELSATIASELKREQRTDSGVSHDSKLVDRNAEPEPADGVAETILKGIDPELLERIKARSTERDTPETPAEKKEKPAKRKEQSRQRQKKRIKEQDSGWEL